MGIKGLWAILTPFCDRKPLYELQGKTVAIDLSCWVCEAQNIAEYHAQPRMYLRNLYFRTCYLLLMDVNPVFVIEGKAPELKYDTINARTVIQFKGARPKSNKTKINNGRTRFNSILKYCEDMLNCMGLVCVKGNGEAEALCACLNEDGLVDGCISQDSDCFAYGAKVVYKNFSISQQGAHASSGGAVDVFNIDKVNEQLGLGRNKIIALAILCGCDYFKGVSGIGKESVVKLFEAVSDKEILDRLRSWKTNNYQFEEFHRKMSEKNICTSCGHHGKLQSHVNNGCVSCKTTRGCDFSKFKDRRLEMKLEMNMRSKALQDANFPNEDLINEFLIRKDNITHLNTKWRQPNLFKFVKFTKKYLEWEEVYSFEKLLPILTRWQLLNYDFLQRMVLSNAKPKGIVYPVKIKKVRNPKGDPCYEILWKDKDDNFKGIIPEIDLVERDLEKLYSTVEPQNLVRNAHPELVESFELSKIKLKKPTKRKQKNTNSIKDIRELLSNTSISESLPKKRTCKKQKESKSKINEISTDDKKDIKPKFKTIDSYFKNAVINCTKLEKDNFGIDSANHSTPVKPVDIANQNLNRELGTSFDINLSSFGDESDSDLSEIIENIVNRKAPEYIMKHLQPNENCDTKIKEDYNNFNGCGGTNSKDVLNESSFFMADVVEQDLFEMALRQRLDSTSDEDPIKNNATESSLGDDTFSEDYVPLLERLKRQ